MKCKAFFEAVLAFVFVSWMPSTVFAASDTSTAQAVRIAAFYREYFGERQGDAKRGRETRAVPPCAWCHGSRGESGAPIFPRIGGQSPVYLEFVLGILKTKFFSIQEAYVMKAVLANISEDEIKAVSEFVSTLDVKSK